MADWLVFVVVVLYYTFESRNRINNARAEKFPRESAVAVKNFFSLPLSFISFKNDFSDDEKSFAFILKNKKCFSRENKLHWCGFQ
jgi:hypothetical protein